MGETICKYNFVRDGFTVNWRISTKSESIDITGFSKGGNGVFAQLKHGLSFTSPSSLWSKPLIKGSLNLWFPFDASEDVLSSSLPEKMSSELAIFSIGSLMSMIISCLCILQFYWLKCLGGPIRWLVTFMIRIALFSMLWGTVQTNFRFGEVESREMAFQPPGTGQGSLDFWSNYL